MMRALPTHSSAGRRVFILAMLGLVTVAPLLGAPAPPPRSATPPAEGDELRGTLQVLMIVSMKKALELSPEQEMQVVPKVRQIFDERESFARQRRNVMHRMQVKLGEDSVPEQEFRSGVVHLEEIERQHREMESRLRNEIDRSLSPRQQAELRLFVPRFRQQMQMHIDEARRLHERRQPSPAPPALLEDLDASEDEEF
jgi:Spy/CpxP family protein refolding chaperone